jgi:hypothetical protein
LVSSFECATVAQRQQVVTAFQQSWLAQQPQDFLGVVHSSSALHGEAGPPDAGLSSELGLADDGPASWFSWLDNPIVIKLQQVVLLVKSVVAAKPSNSIVTQTWSTALEQRCLHFFSPARFAKFVELYWSVWHPNVNILHRPTFDPTSAKTILLAAMALIGE